jgi:hypothetical protein
VPVIVKAKYGCLMTEMPEVMLPKAALGTPVSAGFEGTFQGLSLNDVDGCRHLSESDDRRSEMAQCHETPHMASQRSLPSPIGNSLVNGALTGEELPGQHLPLATGSLRRDHPFQKTG